MGNSATNLRRFSSKTQLKIKHNFKYLGVILNEGNNNQIDLQETIKNANKTYHISRPIRRTFFPPKIWPKFDLRLMRQTYKYPYIYYTTSLSWDSENNHEHDFSGSYDDFLGFYDE